MGIGALPMAGAPPADGAEVGEQALIHRLAGDAGIRDKVAASKARGMWMGGKVPLGNEVANRKLVVNDAEAKSVRQVFECFAETASGTETVQRLQAQRITSKSGRLQSWLGESEQLG